MLMCETLISVELYYLLQRLSKLFHENIVYPYLFGKVSYARHVWRSPWDQAWKNSKSGPEKREEMKIVTWKGINGNQFASKHKYAIVIKDNKWLQVRFPQEMISSFTEVQ